MYIIEMEWIYAQYIAKGGGRGKKNLKYMRKERTHVVRSI